MAEERKSPRLTLRQLLEELIEDDGLELDTRDRAASYAAKLDQGTKKKLKM